MDLSAVAKKLTQASIKGFYNPFEKIQFPETVDRKSWFMSPELISMAGTVFYEKLSESQKKELSFYEAINFFSINIHGEKALLEGLTHRLYSTQDAEISKYLHHFVDEENKHMYFFGTFCEKYAGKIYQDRKLIFPREYVDGEEEFLFFVKVFIFEELVDYYNVKSAKDSVVCELSQQINQNHHEDEVRHLAFGRVALVNLWEKYKSIWSADKVEEIRNYIAGYYQSTWREYYNPDIYTDMKFDKPYELMEEVYNHPSSILHRKKVSRASLQYLVKNGILLSEEII